MTLTTTPPLLSVVLTTHDRPAYLGRALASLAAQTRQDFQIVLCADEGSAATKQVAAHHLRAHDILLVKPGIRGPAESRNLGMGLADGRWITFLDDDDSYLPETVAQLLGHLPASADQVIYFDHHQVVEERDGQQVILHQPTLVPLADRDPANLLVANFIPNNAFAVPTALARQVSFDRRLASLEDWDYLLALHARAPFAYRPLHGPVVHLSADPGRRTMQSFRDQSVALDYLSIYRKWPADSAVCRQQRATLLQGLGLAIQPDFL